MKDFTTSDYITPILTEIKKDFYLTTDEATRNYFNCSLLLTHATTRSAYLVSPEKSLYIPGLKSFRKLCINIQDYTTAAETTPGELDAWMGNELNRVFLAVRDALIKEYNPI